MKWTSLNELREEYLSFFESKDHLRHKSFPLVPIGDKSLLLVNAGMAPLKKYFMGEAEPPRRRMTTCQKCIRTPDIERVGITARHGTYFEMLGNFSFGDYFKRESIEWAWEFVIKNLEMPEDKIWVTVYEKDDEAFDLWIQIAGLPAERIVRLGKEDNFWEIGSGPCGPCSELHFDRGLEFGCGSPDCKPGCDCDRFMEFWNLVFTQFDGDGEGNYTPLASPNIDTGMGLERLACLMQGVNNLFEVDTVRNIMLAVCEKAGIEYGSDPKKDISLRVITDHIRGSSFLISDGVIPTNEGRGYVLRRLLRRAARHGRLLGIKGTFLADICDIVAKENVLAYPELTERLDYVKKIVAIEEERFALTIDHGLEILDQMITDAKASSKTVLDGSDVFKLNDTFGFSIDLTREIASEHGLTVDEKRYDELMKRQKERARKARTARGDFGWTEETFDFLENMPNTAFTGYGEYESSATVLAIVDTKTNEAIGMSSGGNVIVILDRTPFYGESGGQVGDTGILYAEGMTVKVNDTKKQDGIYMHIGEVIEGTLTAGTAVTAKIGAERRDAIKRNHSSTHLLLAALRDVLGTHVEQSGSYVDDKRARFDFSHFKAMTAEEIAKVEEIVNKAILSGHAVETLETDIDSARKMGAIATFGEKYDDIVRVINMGDVSCELCGGTHLDNTAKAGLFKILAESSVAAGVRRIEATTGYGVLSVLAEREALISSTAHELKAADTAELPRKAAQLQGEIKSAKHEIETLNSKLAASQTDDLIQSAVTVKGVRVITARMDGTAVELLRTLGDELKASHDDIIAVFAAVNDGKINFLSVCGKKAVKDGAHAGNILKKISELTGGKGGGRPDSAMSGGGDVSKIDTALDKAPEIISEML